MNIRNYYYFSLRQFIIGIAIIAIVIGWFGRRAYNQKLAITKLFAVSCTYDFELKPRVAFSLFPNANSPQADFFRSILGNEVFGNVIEIEIDDGMHSNARDTTNYTIDYSYLAYLPELETLHIMYPTITNADMANLLYVPKLKSINIMPSAVMMKDNATIPSDWFTEKSFNIIYSLKNLENITLVTNDCSDESIMQLTCLKRLKTIQIFRPPPKHVEPDHALIKQFHEKMPQLNLQDILIH